VKNQGVTRELFIVGREVLEIAKGITVATVAVAL